MTHDRIVGIRAAVDYLAAHTVKKEMRRKLITVLISLAAIALLAIFYPLIGGK
ncbi:MAG TPA: hypothetical protein ACFYD4_07605 [Candidatus Wunengus sp. YC61]|uniref:hypothetical protein n=1 Tax=Candidatus Wunengus sp. YC61 TaxID=3367698 RepID=UPI0040265077